MDPAADLCMSFIKSTSPSICKFLQNKSGINAW
jgi:hypothetical protein